MLRKNILRSTKELIRNKGTDEKAADFFSWPGAHIVDDGEVVCGGIAVSDAALEEFAEWLINE